MRVEFLFFESVFCDIVSFALVRRFCFVFFWVLSFGFVLGLKFCLKLLDIDMNFCWACFKLFSEDLRAAGVRGVMFADGVVCFLLGVVY